MVFSRRGAEAGGFEQTWTFGRVHRLQEQPIIGAENAAVVHVPCFRRQNRHRGRLGVPLKPRLKREADAMIAWWDEKKESGPQRAEALERLSARVC
jgi:hypothetical protein